MTLTTPVEAAPRVRHRSRRVTVAALVILAALGFLVFRGLGNATLYFRTADEAVAQRESLGTKRFRIEGNIVPGSVVQRDKDVDFKIAGSNTIVDVTHRGDPPELFKPGIPVVLEGSFTSSSGPLRFASDRILVKHSESYRAAHPDRVSTPPVSAP